MALGYLITAYDCPNHFGRLIEALLDGADAQIFVHIDGKSDLEPFRARVGDQSRVHFLDDRVAVHWGEFSMVQAVLKLLSEALSSGHALDYLCMLSGTDYPLRSARYIEEFFQRHHGREFITLVEMPNEEYGKPIERLTTYRAQTGERAGDAGRQRDYRPHLAELRPCGGSPWWALSGEACRYALDFARRRPEVVDFFRNTFIPEEMFLHTILGNSPFRARVARNLTYVDWTRSPRAAHPATIDPQHLPFLTRTPVLAPNGDHELLFARKFPDDSESLVARLRHNT